ncbi:jg16015 [Pararge aegeria aegeria]|uniref:Jg16015 protein n=1 Tax=Pararge aegeria aegeria TaxID=348720 RepID=A0A8S4SIU0_9NEOP|nr:jg16015 [Pararge aegeria aegeria]
MNWVRKDCHMHIILGQLGHHGLSCNRSAGRLYRHGAINDIFRRALASASIPAQLEPPGFFRDDGKRPDGMTIVPWSMGRALVCDATCVVTLAASHLPSTSQKAAAAAESAQMLKRRKYSVICNDYVFAALAFETLGPWCSDTKNFINIVSQKLVLTSGDPRAGVY